MSSEDQLPEDLIGLERSLAQLEPAASRIDRDRLMYAAGAAGGVQSGSHQGLPIDSEATGLWTTFTRGLRRRGSRRILGWQIATAASILVASLFGWLYSVQYHRPSVTIREIVYVDRPVVPPGAAIAAPENVPDPSVGSQGAGPPTEDRVFEPPTIQRFAFNTQRPNYVAFRQMAILHGVDALPRRVYRGPVGGDLTRARTASELLKEFLPARSASSRDSHGGWFPESSDHSQGEAI